MTDFQQKVMKIKQSKNYYLYFLSIKFLNGKIFEETRNLLKKINKKAKRKVNISIFISSVNLHIYLICKIEDIIFFS